MSGRLLALRALGLGDLLTAVPALRGLARAFPEHEPTLATTGSLAPIVELLPEPWRLVSVGELEPLPSELDGADLAVNLHGRGPQSHRILLGARPRRLLCFEHADVSQSRGGPRWRPGEHEVLRWCRMLAESGVPCSPAELDLDPPPGPPPSGTEGATLIHPGAASPARRWPEERFAAVIRAALECGHRVVITGTAAERALAERVASAAGLAEDAVLAGRTDLGGLASAVAAAGRLICGDTGVAHLATAFGTPSVVLFGPTSPAHWGPPAERSRHRVLWAGRSGDPHGARPHAGLLELQPDAVMAALEELPSPEPVLERGSAASARQGAGSP